MGRHLLEQWMVTNLTEIMQSNLSVIFHIEWQSLSGNSCIVIASILNVEAPQDLVLSTS